MKTLVNIYTQVLENGKAKGGQIFQLRVLSDLFLYGEEQCVDAIKVMLAEQSNEYVRYTYTDHELVFHEPIALDDNLFEEYFRIENEKVS